MDPLFVDPITNFRLQFTSPAINMGENSAVHDSTDLEGLPREVSWSISEPMKASYKVY